eukprot:TRINITY_DN6619_c0_g1_i2.p1 TRINITY_DN6619_c0_g1~~TRINITY_DN6619_c0_g1_i2.p1  ORF type:complete len:276 (-),score=66.37 TRINITY_DN6619_c0_g1_i2:22-849(-)
MGDSADWVRDGSVQILYIKRAVNESDRWSGDVAFPGGRRQKSDRDDQATAERETFEELGLQLSNRLQFMCLGHIDDLQILPGRNVKKMVLSCYVYLQLTAHTPAFHLQRTEIAAHRWVRADALYSSPRIVSLRFSLSSFNPSIRAPQALLSSLGLDPVHLPAVLLPPADLDVGRPANLDVGQPADPNVGDEEDLSQEFCLWGLTLGRTSELLSIASKPRLDRPPISTNNVFANHVIRSRFGNRSPHGISLPLFSYQLSLATALLLGAYFELRARM